jgi:hypothetical protein
MELKENKYIMGFCDDEDEDENRDKKYTHKKTLEKP